MKSLQAYIYQEIPITRQMGIQLLSSDKNSLVMSAPLQANINDKQSAFAGSLATVVTLSGWALTMMTLKNAGFKADVAIVHSDIKYLKPVTDNFQATCVMPDENAVQQFIETLQSGKRARWSLSSTITTADTDDAAVVFTGSYVAILKT